MRIFDSIRGPGCVNIEKVYELITGLWILFFSIDTRPPVLFNAHLSGGSVSDNSELFFLELLSEIVETSFYTSSVRDEIPVSLILVGPSGSAKSKLIRRYTSEQIHTTDSLTSQGIWEIAQRDTKGEKRFIFMPDINPTLSRRSSTQQATIGNLLTLTGDGTVRIDDGRGEKICQHAPMGMITACTPEIYHRHSRHWYALGLIRRIIPVFYSYSSKTQDALQKLVRDGKIHASFGMPKQILLPPSARPALSNSDTLMEFEGKSKDLAHNLGKIQYLEKGIKRWQIKNVVPISPHVTIRTLAMAHALRRRSAKVEDIEVEFIKDFVSFTDPEAPRQL